MDEMDATFHTEAEMKPFFFNLEDFPLTRTLPLYGINVPLAKLSKILCS